MHLFTCIKHPQNLLSMDTFYVYIETLTRAHTKFMIVTLFRERERERIGPGKRMMEEFILNLLFLKKQKFITMNVAYMSLIHCSQWFPYLFNFLKTLLSFG